MMIRDIIMDQVKLNEQTTSQIPTLHMLQSLGNICLTSHEALSRRGRRLRNVLMEDFLVC